MRALTRPRSLAAALAAVLALAAPPGAAGQATFTFTGFDGPNGALAMPTGINDAGTVFGFSSTVGPGFFFWPYWINPPTINMKTGRPMPPEISRGVTSAFFTRTSGGSYSVIPTLPHFTSPSAWVGGGINNAGEAVGSCLGVSLDPRGFAPVEWAGLDFRSGGFTPFKAGAAVSNGQVNTYATGINNAGQVVGMRAIWTGQAFKTEGFLTSLRNTATWTPIDAPAALWTLPTAINDAGEVVGSYLDTSLRYHAFIRTPAGKLTTLDLPGAGITVPLGVNNAGQIVGFVASLYPGSKNDIIGPYKSFLRNADGSVVTFNPTGTSAWGSVATGINNQGVIVGMYNDVLGDYTHGYIATPARH